VDPPSGLTLRQPKPVCRLGGSHAAFGLLVFDEGRFDYDVAEVFLDPETAFQHSLNDRLVVHHAARDELQEIVVAAADEVALDDFIDLANARFEEREIAAAMFRQRDVGKDDQKFAEFVEVDKSAVTGDIAGAFKAFFTGEARVGERETAAANSTFVMRPERCNSARILRSIRSNLGLASFEIDPFFPSVPR
jgi:hypothetical protein